MHGLIANVAFATESSYALQQVLGTMLQEQSFLSPAAVEKMMNEAQARIRGHIAELISRYKTHFEQIHDKTERKKQLERSYSALLIVNRIKTDFCFSSFMKATKTPQSGFLPQIQTMCLKRSII